MAALVVACLIIAAIFAALAAFGVGTTGPNASRFSLLAAAVFFLVLAFLLPAFAAVL